MTPADLTAAGRALFGTQWQKALAQALGVAPRTVRRWIAGERHPAPAVEEEILDLLASAWASRIVGIAADMGGRPNDIMLCTYRDDDELVRLTGEPWAAAFHHRLMERLAARLEERGIETELGEVDEPGYLNWLDGRENTAEARAAYAALKT
jgi:transcriptional regulator with XRE-family HTH domain